MYIYTHKSSAPTTAGQPLASSKAIDVLSKLHPRQTLAQSASPRAKLLETLQAVVGAMGQQPE